MCNLVALRKKKGNCVILVDAQEKRSHTYIGILMTRKSLQINIAVDSYNKLNSER